MKKIPEAFVMKGVPKALSAAAQAERRNLKSGREVKITRETPLSFVAGFQTKVSQDPNSKKDSSRHASRSFRQTSATQKYTAAKDGGTTSGKRRRDADAASTLKEKKVSNLGEELDEKVLSDDRIFARVLPTIPSASPPEKSTLCNLIKELQLGDENNIFSTEGTAPEGNTTFSISGDTSSISGYVVIDDQYIPNSISNYSLRATLFVVPDHNWYGEAVIYVTADNEYDYTDIDTLSITVNSVFDQIIEPQMVYPPNGHTINFETLSDSILFTWNSASYPEFETGPG